MNLGEWKRDVFYVWRESRKPVMVHSLIMYALAFPFVALCMFSPMAALALSPVAMVVFVLAWAHLHVLGYEAVRQSGTRLAFGAGIEAVKKNWLSLMLGYGLWCALYMVGSIFVLPALVIVAVLMPYLLFIAVEGRGPIDALETNVRLAGDRLAEIVVAWLALVFGVMVILMPVVGVLMGAIVWSASGVEGPTVALMGVGAVVLFAVTVVGQSLQVAGAVTAYRVLRGQSVDAVQTGGHKVVQTSSGAPVEW
ncbi:hypothetical protein FRC98_17895 [Lujinxingia vulgaris]|uniref:Glycerophosphoryl diester phosphodiesterase membrane domain-containing protein n=1 Tax=Lujinxingia vulgaris TaxID=2600176 RepID=A0A5C6X7B0_9DELT|nr:hypothetical protein [Lujinxingia vulgaris]TXD34991.1 hypothetical protein FRC98_17895 [Lujinxingia vulgaris]